MRHLFAAVATTILLTPNSAGASGLDYGSGSGNDDPAYRAAASADLIVRPDLARLPFALRTENPDPERGLYSLKVAATELEKRAKAAVPCATVKLRGVGVEEASSSPSKARGTNRQVSADGEIDVALPDADYWARAKVLAGLEKLARDFADAAREGKAGYTASFSPAVALVRDPEKHRGALLKGWVERARQLADVAATRPPLQVAECNPPGRVAQRTVSLEEVELTLEVACAMRVSPAAK